jgi:hypothetical protein
MTQVKSLTEMCTMNFPGSGGGGEGKARSAQKADNLCEPTV